MSDHTSPVVSAACKFFAIEDKTIKNFQTALKYFRADLTFSVLRSDLVGFVNWKSFVIISCMDACRGALSRLFKLSRYNYVSDLKFAHFYIYRCHLGPGVEDGHGHVFILLPAVASHW